MIKDATLRYRIVTSIKYIGDDVNFNMHNGLI